MPNSFSFNLALVIAILSSAFASGGIISLSLLTVPALLLPSASLPPSSSPSRAPATPLSHLAHQWLLIHHRGKHIYPSLAATSALAFSYLATYSLHSRPDKLARMYVTAAAFTIAIVPFTLGVIMPTNRRIEACAMRHLRLDQESEKEEEEEDKDKAEREKEDQDMPQLMVKWAWLNTIRGVFPLMGAAIGATAATLC
ncbi:hypothetical protein APHAL10511_006939 [Amanita phalloides]|nr:hypothetical protein APHAL10511_006939 [Amanita phalloides]